MEVQRVPFENCETLTKIFENQKFHDLQRISIVVDLRSRKDFIQKRFKQDKQKNSLKREETFKIYIDSVFACGF